MPRLDLKALDDAVLDPLTKGLPFATVGLSLGEIGNQGWSLFDGDLPLPAAILKRDVISANSTWMSRFAAMNGLVMAPHGKTTMAPHLYDMQIADGAWAITVATAQQLEVCARFGVKRVVLANQPIGKLAVDACFRVVAPPDSIELYCLADSLEGVALLAGGALDNPPPDDNPLRVLVEIGFEGGRTGARSEDLAIAVARAVAGTPGLGLAGFECFEGILPDTGSVDDFLDKVVSIAVSAEKKGLLPTNMPMVLSAGGSAFFDRVGERFQRIALRRPIVRVLRSGCYLTHDSLILDEAFQRIVGETRLVLPEGGLKPALEVWAHVQSRPDPTRAILTVGKRDISHDAGLPVPVGWIRPNGAMQRPEPVSDGHVVEALNDQHCHLAVPSESPLQVGDMVGFGISHPCTTFDKWSLLMVVDDAYRVVGAVRTFF
ncbi:MAG: amino acid aldolase [Hyphomicrobiales bacterium]|nr:amino acid aldolase [Hyphomicrobiales bacterium]